MIKNEKLCKQEEKYQAYCKSNIYNKSEQGFLKGEEWLTWYILDNK